VGTPEETVFGVILLIVYAYFRNIVTTHLVKCALPILVIFYARFPHINERINVKEYSRVIIRDINNN